MSATVMITGGTGYLGHAVVQECLQAGYRVRALVRDPARLSPECVGRVQVVQGDLQDIASVVNAARGADAIFHLAGLASDWARDPAAFHAVNVEGTRNVLAAAKTAGVTRVVATNTVMALGPTDGLDEASETTTRPHKWHFMPYQLTKARALELCQEARSEDLAVTVVMPGALYGAGPSTDGNYLSRILGLLADGKIGALPKVQSQRWTLVHVQDAARGHIAALERGEPDGTYILGGDCVSLERILTSMADGLALASLPRRVPAWVLLSGLAAVEAWNALWGTRPPLTRAGGRAFLHDWAFSSQKAVRELGYAWRPFDTAFPEFVRWFDALPAPPGVTEGRRPFGGRP